MISFGINAETQFVYVPGWTKVVMGEMVLPSVEKATNKIAANAYRLTPKNASMNNDNYYFYSHIDGHGFARGVVYTGNPYAVAHNKKYNTLIKACGSVGSVV